MVLGLFIISRTKLTSGWSNVTAKRPMIGVRRETRLLIESERGPTFEIAEILAAGLMRASGPEVQSNYLPTAEKVRFDCLARQSGHPTPHRSENVG